MFMENIKNTLNTYSNLISLIFVVLVVFIVSVTFSYHLGKTHDITASVMEALKSVVYLIPAIACLFIKNTNIISKEKTKK